MSNKDAEQGRRDAGNGLRPNPNGNATYQSAFKKAGK